MIFYNDARLTAAACDNKLCRGYEYPGSGNYHIVAVGAKYFLAATGKLAVTWLFDGEDERTGVR